LRAHGYCWAARSEAVLPDAVLLDHWVEVGARRAGRGRIPVIWLWSHGSKHGAVTCVGDNADDDNRNRPAQLEGARGCSKATL
jgi:hypothetical protein